MTMNDIPHSGMNDARSANDPPSTSLRWAKPLNDLFLSPLTAHLSPLTSCSLLHLLPLQPLKPLLPFPLRRCALEPLRYFISIAS